MIIAAWQMPIEATEIDSAMDAVRQQVRCCEERRVTVLCCPEGAIGGLADYAADPTSIAIATDNVAGRLMPIASDTVTLIVGFTELGPDGHLYNAAAVIRRGSGVGVYRKLNPAIRRSVYSAGREIPVFERDSLRFGIAICYDSTFREPARAMARKGASVLFFPSNNGLPLDRKVDGLVDEARACDVARATENRVWVVRADVAGRTRTHGSAGSTGIVDPSGVVVGAATAFCEGTLTFEWQHGAVQ